MASVTPRAFAAAAAGILLVVGIVLLFTPVGITTAGGTDVPCGALTDSNSGLLSKADLAVYEHHMTNALSGGLVVDPMTDATQLCDSATSTRETWVLVLGGAGILGLLGCATVKRAATAAPKAPPAAAA